MVDFESPLPTELWRMILVYLPKADRRTCLFVSRLLRDLARAVLFRHITIYFGYWTPNEDREEHMINHYPTEWQDRNTASWEILRHIKGDAHFASTIRKLSVRAHSNNVAIFERHCLADALASLPNLSSFVYHGEWPVLHPDMLKSINIASSATLTELYAPISYASTWMQEGLFPDFPNLRALVLARGPYDSCPSTADLIAVRTCLESSRALHRLHVSGEAIWAAPVRVFMNLQELVIQDPESLSGLPFTVRHLAQLQSLALILGKAFSEQHLISALNEDQGMLPELASFKLICHGPASVRDAEAVAHFLRRKRRLRRLDVELNVDPTDHGTRANHMPFFELLADFPKLEVVGISIRGDEFATEKLERIHEVLPIGLKALLITFDFAKNDVPPIGWIDMLRERTSLGYIHLLDMERTLDLKQQILEDHPESLELVGYGPHLRWIERDPETNQPMYSLRWPEDKLAFRGVEDFGCEDREWLLKCHDWEGIDSLYPGLLVP